MLGQNPIEVDRETNYRLLHVLVPALPASSIILKHTDDTAHSDEQRLLELLPQLDPDGTLHALALEHEGTVYTKPAYEPIGAWAARVN